MRSTESLSPGNVSADVAAACSSAPGIGAHFLKRLPSGGWRMVLLMCAAGAFGALALPPLTLFPVLIPSLGLLYLAAQAARNWKQAAWRGFFYGMGLHTAGLYWLTNAILTRVHEFWWVVPFAAPGVALVIAPLIAVPAVVCRYGAPGWPRVLIFAGCWTLADMCRVLIFSGFPWNPLGSALEVPGRAGDVLLQPASLIGVNGLTFCLVLASLAMWLGRRGQFGVLAVFGLWCGWGSMRLYHARPLTVPMPVVVLVQGNVSEDEVLGHIDPAEQFGHYLQMTARGVQQAETLLARLRQSPERGAQLRGIAVVWPESAFPALLDEQPVARQMIARASGNALALIGSDRRENGHWFNSLEAVGPQGRLEAIYDKSRLVPFGEYQPWIIPFNLLPGQLTPGAGLVRWDLPQAGRVGPMVCYEVVFSGGVVARQARPDWLLTISNDAWYGNSAGPWQHLATGRMRAVEEGLALVFANNRGPSGIFDSLGRETAHTHWGQEAVLVAPVPPPLAPTFFARFHNWTAGLSAFAGIVAGFLLSWGRKEEKPR
ncbi:apolipoprotein N-acyltransferase [Oecophyllibacter saccharovorans]|nr:apolipoprotein N-acyltransferase [Oecophyllibacter saccharovorans]